MNPDDLLANENSPTPEPITLKEEILNQKIILETGHEIIGIEPFNPQINKGVYAIAENQQHITQCILLTKSPENIEKTEVFVKYFQNKEKARIEQESYKKCSKYKIPSLELVCGIETKKGIFNITKTENYLIPYSVLKITSIHQYKDMIKSGLFLLNKIHEIGILHRDALTRNFAILSNKPNTSLIFDFATAVLKSNTKELTEEQKKQETNFFIESLFFQLLKQNPGNMNLIKRAENISVEKENLYHERIEI